MEVRMPPPEQLTERELGILIRLSSGLSDQQIADELFLSLNTVKWYNRQIYGKLGVASRTQAVAHARALGLTADGRRAVASSAPAPAAWPSGLPTPSTPFVGRQAEIAELRQMLGECRLLTLTGTGGIGKTRLALRLAVEVGGDFPDGVYFVDLAPLSDPALVARAIARALGVSGNPSESMTDTLKRALAQREALLLIDNFEQVVQAAPLVSDLLAACPRSKALVTSREPLRLAGEQEYPVPPLSLPTEDAASPQNVVQSEAGALFVQRARMSQPHFEVSAENASAIAGICRRLDGIPLALELAAARSKLLAPSSLLARLVGSDESPLGVLAGGARDAPARQRTLRGSIEWSYDLLDRDDKVLFARLSVFRGSCSLEAVESVCAEGLSADVFDALASLVDKSLVQQREAPDGEPRFSLLEMVREYARERLAASGEAPALHRRHATYLVELAERFEPELRLAGYDRCCRRLELELDNLRAALEWALGPGDVVLGVRLAGASNLFWYGKRHHVEGLRWAQQLLARLDETPVIYHAKFLIFAGHMLWFHDLDAARGLFSRALGIARDLGDRLMEAWALIFQGYTTMEEPDAAIPIVEEGLALFRALGYQPGIAQALNNLGEVARLSGDDRRARRAYEECLSVCQATGEVRRTYYMVNNLAYIALHEGDYERALELGRQALDMTRARDSQPDSAQALMTLAGPIAALGRPRDAVLLLSAAEVACERMGALIQPNDRLENDRVASAARSQLGEDQFQAAWAEGRQMTLEQAVEYALRDEE